MIPKSSPTMNHHFDSYHQSQNYFDHLTLQMLTLLWKKNKKKPKPKNPTQNQMKTQNTAFFLFATQGTACVKNQIVFLLKMLKTKRN